MNNSDASQERSQKIISVWEASKEESLSLAKDRLEKLKIYIVIHTTNEMRALMSEDKE